MRGLGAEREEIPYVIRLLDVGVWVALLGVDEVGELERIANEKDRRGVADEDIVALLRLKLDREAARIARPVGRALLARHGREADEELGAFARELEKFRLGPLRYVRSDLEITVSPPNLWRGPRVRVCVRGRSGRAFRSGDCPRAGPARPRPRFVNFDYRRPERRFRSSAGCVISSPFFSSLLCL